MRDGQEVFRSPALQHFFDCPLQFAAYPDYTSATDTADDAGIYEIGVEVTHYSSGDDAHGVVVQAK